MKKLLVAISALLVLAGTRAGAQSQVTLGQCIAGAREVHRLAGEAARHAAIGSLNSASLRSSRLPTADAGAGIVYNSDVPDLAATLSGVPVPGLADLIPAVPHAQYRFTLELSQLIYDGGTAREMQRINDAATLVSARAAEVELYSSAGKVITWYYAILLLDRHNEILTGYGAATTARLSAVESAVAAGVLTPADYDMVAAEKLKLDKLSSDNRNLAESARRTLSELTGIAIDNSTSLAAESVLSAPATESPVQSDAINRPELELFDLTAMQLTAAQQLAVSARRPKVYGFATLGYGNPPGNNFFRDAFEPYMVAGASVKWNIWDWNRTSREKEILQLKHEITKARKDDAAGNILRALDAKNTEIQNLEASIATCGEIAGLRKRISASAASQFSNGAITAAEFIGHTSAEREAVTELEIQKITLMRARAEYRFLQGIDLKQIAK